MTEEVKQCGRFLTIRWIFNSIFIGILICCVVGCSKAPDIREAEAFFTEWLISHGETDVVVDAEGVGIAGNKTRLQASVYGFEKYNDGGYNVEMEFKVRLPSNDIIIEYVAGMGESKKQAVDDAYLNFTLTTFHVIYYSFMNPSDPHHSIEQVECNGKMRDFVMGSTIIKAEVDYSNLTNEVFALEPEIQAAIASLPLSGKTYWFKIVYSQMDSKLVISEVTMDNQSHEELTNVITALNWPKKKGFYMTKQFIIVKPLSDDG